MVHNNPCLISLPTTSKNTVLSVTIFYKQLIADVHIRTSNTYILIIHISNMNILNVCLYLQTDEWLT